MVTQPITSLRGARQLLPLIGIIAIAACGGGGTATASPSPQIGFDMVPQNGSHVAGAGQVEKGTGSFTVTIRLTGLAPGSSHVSHVHAGSCAAPGGIAFALQEVIADSSGSATATSTVLTTYSVPTSGWYVNVHHGPDFTEAEYAPSDSCGDLPAT
jgi:CHRD domain